MSPNLETDENKSLLEPECSICLAIIINKKDLFTTECKTVDKGKIIRQSHTYHNECLYTWYTTCKNAHKKPTCPQCRSALETNHNLTLLRAIEKEYAPPEPAPSTNWLSFLCCRSGHD